MELEKSQLTEPSKFRTSLFPSVIANIFNRLRLIEPDPFLHCVFSLGICSSLMGKYICICRRVCTHSLRIVTVSIWFSSKMRFSECHSEVLNSLLGTTGHSMIGETLKVHNDKKWKLPEVDISKLYVLLFLYEE